MEQTDGTIILNLKITRKKYKIERNDKMGYNGLSY